MAEIKPRRAEQIVKGFSNHRRIQILELLDQSPEMSLNDISDTLVVNFRTASDHIRKMTVAGLVMKRHDGPEVRHKLTTRGTDVLKFLRILE